MAAVTCQAVHPFMHAATDNAATVIFTIFISTPISAGQILLNGDELQVFIIFLQKLTIKSIYLHILRILSI